MKHYAIGDVHGEFDTLIELTSKLPEDAKFIFVGDLIDRGPESKKVIDFIRKGNHQSVMGNHEDMMIKEAQRMKEEGVTYIIDELWAVNGGLPTLKSYGIIEMIDDGTYKYTKDEESIAKFIDDAKWMRELPLYIKAPVKWKDTYDIAITHAALGDTVWSPSGKGQDFSHIPSHKEHILCNREQRGANPTFQVFNVFGHTPQRDTKYVNIGGVFLRDKNWINIDSGCAYDKPGLGRLTALNLETLETFSEDRV